jgi:triphosphatase
LLAAQGVVVRLRKEGRQWVQTAKAPGSRTLERLEHNVALGVQAAPLLDLARHQHAPVGDCIRHALQLKPDAAFPALVMVYSSNIVRLSRLVRVRGTVVEIALDQGHIAAGNRTLPVNELELELKQGEPAEVVALAASWCARHGLWLSSVSKSIKGQRLALGKAFGTATGASPMRYSRQLTGQAMAAAVVSNCLGQVLANASDVAAGCTDGDVIHQLRVGIRRLRTALRELSVLAGGWNGHSAAWEAPLVAVFRELGQHRDRDYLLHKLQGQIAQAGGPALDWQGALGDLPDAATAVRSPAFQQTQLGLIGFVHAADHVPEHQDKTPKKVLRRRLARLHGQVLTQGKQFSALPETEQHSLRKRLKRLRYLAEFSQPLFSARKTKAYLDELKPLQDALGTYHDEVAALQAWQTLSGHQPLALFGAGWLSARREPHVLACQQACNRLARKARPFWE